MELQALGYFGIRASNLDDWAAFATRLVGFELVEKSKSSLTFRMDDRRQRVVVEADHDDGAAFFGGTFFPADDPVTGRGLKQILPEIVKSYRDQRAFIVQIGWRRGSRRRKSRSSGCRRRSPTRDGSRR